MIHSIVLEILTKIDPTVGHESAVKAEPETAVPSTGLVIHVRKRNVAPNRSAVTKRAAQVVQTL